MDELGRAKGFQWDEGNSEKNLRAHGVSNAECEQVFFNRPLVTALDVKHSRDEARYFALGETDAGRGLFVVFTLRSELIRIISARDMNRRERGVYGHAKSEE